MQAAGINLGGDGISGTGALTIAPSVASSTIGLGDSASGDLNLDAAELTLLQDGFSSITIGDAAAGTGAVDINASTFADDVTIVGGSITVTELDAGANSVTLRARTGAIADGGDVGADVSGGAVTLNSATGVGTAGNAIETAVTSLTAAASTSGGIFINETDGISLNTQTVAADGDVTITSGGGQLDVAFGQIIATTGTGSVSLTAAQNILLNAFATITTVDGGITLNANPSGAQSGDFIGLNSNLATIRTTGSGNIQLLGKGAETGGNTANLYGVFLRNGTSVSSTATGTTAGTITITGSGGAGTLSNHGAVIAASTTSVTSVDGAILITGTGGNGANGGDVGVLLSSIGMLASTGTGPNAATITISGTGGTGSSNNYGVEISNSSATVTSVDGDIAITGQGGNGNGLNIGVFLNYIGTVSSTGTGASAANITINGTAGDGTTNNFGVSLAGSTTDVTSIAGDISITGTGGNGTDDAIGVDLDTDATVQVTDGALAIAGTAVAGNASGVRLDETGGGRLLSIGSGSISITATGIGIDADFRAGADSRIGYDGATATSTNITIIADSIEWDGSLNVESNGALAIQPRSTATTIGLGNSATGTLNLTTTELGFLQDGFSSITIGDSASGTGAVDINASSFADDVTIAGGSIDVDGLDAGSNTATLTARTGVISTAGGVASNPIDVTAATLIVNGDVAPGASPGQLVVDGDVTFDASDSLIAELNGTTVGTEYDQLRVEGSVRVVTLGNATLTLSSSASLTTGDELVIIDNVDSGSFISGTFAGLAEGAAVSFGSNRGTISYAAGADGNDAVITVDNTAPMTTSFTRQNPVSSPTNADVLVFRATFSKVVTGVDTADFAVNGVTTATITNVSTVSASQYDVTVSGGDLADFNGLVGLDFAGSISIADLVGNALPNAEPATDETYLLDNVAPSTTSFTRQTPSTNSTNADVLVFRVTFSEDVTDVDAADFAVNGTTTATVTNISTVSGLQYDVTVSGGDLANFTGVVGLDFAGSISIADPAGNAVPNAGPATNETFTLDNTAPSAVSFTRQSPATTLTADDVLVFRATFSEDVTGVDAADFAVSGAATATITNVSAISASQYDVTVSGGDLASFNGTVGLDLSGAVSIADLLGNALSTTEPATDETYLVDNAAPSTTSFTRQNPSASQTNADVLVFRATFSEDVSGVDVADFAVDGTTTAVISNVSAVSASQYDVTVSGGDLADFSGVVGLDFSGSISITDLLGNSLPNSEPTTDETYDLDNVSPTADIGDVTPDPRNSTVGILSVTFSSSVTGVDISDFQLTRDGMIVDLSSVAVIGTDNSYSIDLTSVTASEGAYMLTLAALASGIEDMSGNALLGDASDDWITDTTAPTVTVDIVDAVLSDADNVSLVTFEFSEAVSGFDATDLSVSGGVLSDFMAVDADSFTAMFTANDGTEASGSVSVGTGYLDAAGNSGTEAADSVTIDTLNPTATVDIADLSLNDGDRNSVVTFEFSEAVASFDLSDVTVSGGTLSGLTAIDSDSFSAVFTASENVEGTGTVSIGTGYSDLVGNQGQGDSDTVTIDTQNPSVAISFSPDQITRATFSSTVTFQFSEAVTGFDLFDVNVAGGALINFMLVSADQYSAVLLVTGGIETTGSASVTSGYTDLAGNAGSSASETISIDTAAPTATVDIVETVLSDDHPSLVTFQFSEPVTFDLSDVTVAGGSLSSFSLTAANTFTATLTADDDLVGTASVTVNPTYSDLAGNTGTGDSDTARIDTRNPSAVIVPDGVITNAAVIPFMIQFDENVTGLTLDDFSFVNGTADSLLMVNGSTWQLRVIPQSDGPVSVRLATGATQDSAGNFSDSTATNVISDRTGPLPAISGPSSPTNLSSFDITVTFSETVAGFGLDDLVIANGSARDLVPLSDRSFSATIDSAADGLVTIDLPRDAVTDPAGNGNSPAAFSVSVRSALPVPTIVSSAVSPTNVSPIPMLVLFSETVTGFDSSDVMVTGGSVVDFSGSNRTYTFGLVPTGDGPLTVDIDAGAAQNDLGTASQAATPFTIVSDTTAPSLMILPDGTSTSDSPILFTFQFSEPVAGFAPGDVSITNGVGGSFSSVDSDTFTLEVTPSGNGTVTVSTAMDAARDAAGNGSLPASAVVTFESTDPQPANATLPGASAYEVLRDGDDLILRFAGGSELSRETASLVSFLRIAGSPGDDTVTVLDTGIAVDTPLIFAGGDGNDVFDATPAVGAVNLTGNGGDDVLKGGSADDTLNGGTGADELVGGPGNDLVQGNGGTGDTLDGGDGDDTLNGGSGNDLIREFFTGDATLTNLLLTGRGSDVVISAERADFSGGGLGQTFDVSAFYTPGLTSVTLDGGGGNDTLIGSNGNDVLVGSGGGDQIEGRDGNDYLVGGSGADTLIGGAGDDELRGLGGSGDRLSGGDGDDILNGGRGIDRVFETGDVDFTLTTSSLTGLGTDRVQAIEIAELNGGESDNVIDVSAFVGFRGFTQLRGNGGNDFLIGSVMSDILNGGDGNDTLQGKGGNDTLNGENGNDALTGFTGNDVIDGGRGYDRIFGGEGNDTLTGGAARDTLIGGDGDDSINGNDGIDTLAGGTGNNDPSPGDVITDATAVIDEAFVLDPLPAWVDQV